MLDGNKVMPKGWVDAYVFFNGTHFVREDGKQFLFGSLEYEWEIYEEPKPKQTVTVEKWLLKMQGTEQYAIEEGSKEEMNTWGKYKTDAWKKVKLLDTYEVEL